MIGTVGLPVKTSLRSNLFWVQTFQFESLTERQNWVARVQYRLTALCARPRPTVVSRTTTINYIIQENIATIYATSMRVRIRAVASGQDGELHAQFGATTPPQTAPSPHSCAPTRFLDSHNVMIHVFRASWAPCEGRYMPVPGPDGLVPLYTTTCSSAPQPHSRIQPR